MKPLPVPALRAFALYVLCAASASAQVSAPYTQDFESFPTCSNSCGVACPLPAGSGWANATTDAIDWTTDTNGTPSGATGPSVDHTLGTALGKYLYTESSGCFNLTAELLSPVLQVTGNANPRVRFWYHMLGATMGTMHVDVIEDPNGAPIRTNDVVTAFTDNVDVWQLTPWITLSPAAAGGEVQIVIRGMTGTSFTSDMAVDDFEFGEGFAIDAAITDLDFNSGLCSNSLTQVTATIFNEGLSSISNAPVTLSVNGVPQFTENFPGPLAPGTSAQYSFSGTVTAPPGALNLEVSIALPGDGNPTNDAFARAIVINPLIDTFPYLESFEGGAGGWTSSGTLDPWALGTPAKPVINSAHSGVNAWVTDLVNVYQPNTLASVESPCFDVSTLVDPKFKAWVWWNAEFSWDGAQLQYSTDGSSWTKIGSFGDPGNWYTDDTILGLNSTGSQEGWSGRVSTSNGSGGWVQVEHDLPDFGGASTISLRIIFGSDGSVQDDGFAFDDVEITGAAADLAITKSNGANSATPGTNSSYVITVSNAGPAPVMGATVADTFPVGGCSSVSWTCAAAGGATCTAAGTGDINDSVDLPVAGTATYTAVCAIPPSASGSLVNTATVSPPANVVDPDLNNNSATDDDPLVASADMSINLTDSPDPVNAGTNLGYMATLTNNGPSDAQGVSVTLPIPAGTGFVSADAGAGGACTTPTVGAGGTISCSWAGVTANSATRVLTASVSVPASATAALSTTATVAASTSDGNAGNDTSTASTAVGGSADLALSFSATPAQVAPGLPFNLMATVTNNGPSDAQNVQLSVAMGAGVQFRSLTTSAGASCTTPTLGATGTVVCSFAGATPPAGVRSVDVTVYSYARGTVQSTATASSATSDPTPANNSASGSVILGTDPSATPILIPSNHPGVLALLAVMFGLLGYSAVRRRG